MFVSFIVLFKEPAFGLIDFFPYGLSSLYFIQFLPNLIYFNFHLVEGLAIVDTHHAAHHL